VFRSDPACTLPSRVRLCFQKQLGWVTCIRREPRFQSRSWQEIKRTCKAPLTAAELYLELQMMPLDDLVPSRRGGRGCECGEVVDPRAQRRSVDQSATAIPALARPPWTPRNKVARPHRIRYNNFVPESS